MNCCYHCQPYPCCCWRPCDCEEETIAEEEDYSICERECVYGSQTNSPTEQNKEWITLPLAFQLLDFEMIIDSVQIGLSPLRCEDVTSSIITKVNEIWSPAKIKFEVTECKNHQNLLQNTTEAEHITVIERADANGSYNGKEYARGEAVEELVFNGRFQQIPRSINIYVLPSIGKGLLGLSTTNPEPNSDFEGAATVASHENTAVLPFTAGETEKSLAKVIAHKLGFIMNLTGQANCAGCLMASREQPRGYKLLDAHINVARAQAERILQILQTPQTRRLTSDMKTIEHRS